MRTPNRGANGNNGSKWCRPSTRLALYIRAGFRCAWCGRDLTGAKPRDVTLDHLTPREDGGSHAPDNLIMACLSCNSARGNTPWRVWAFVQHEQAAAARGELTHNPRTGEYVRSIDAAGRETVRSIDAQRFAPLNRALARAIIRGEHPDPRGRRRSARRK